MTTAWGAIPPPSPAVAQAAASMTLGQLVRPHGITHSLAGGQAGTIGKAILYKVMTWFAWLLLVFAGVGFFTGLPLLGAGLLVAAVLILVIGYLMLKRMAVKGAPASEYLYEYELGLACPTQDSAIAFRWSDIVQIYEDVIHYANNGIYRHTYNEYTLVASNGWKVKFSGQSNRNRPDQVFGLLPAFHQKVLEPLVSAAVNRINAGGQVPFGAVAIAGQGIVGPQGGVPWGRVSEMAAKDGKVRIKVDGQKWWSADSKTVPNFQVFWHLAEQLRAGQQQPR